MYKFKTLRKGPINLIITLISFLFFFFVLTPSDNDDKQFVIIFGTFALSLFAILFEWYIKLVEILWFTPARIRDSITAKLVERLNKIKTAENNAKREFERFIEDCRK